MARAPTLLARRRARGRALFTDRPLSAKKVWLACLAFSLALPLVSAAQGPIPMPPDGPPPPGDEAGGEAASRRETVRIYLVQRMREKLQLSEAQTLKVLDVLQTMDDLRPAAREAMQRQVLRAQALLADPATPDSSFKELVASVKKEQADWERKMQDQEEKLLAIMTPRQQAQWMLLRRELMARLKNPDGPGPGPGGEPGQDRPLRRRLER